MMRLHWPRLSWQIRRSLGVTRQSSSASKNRAESRRGRGRSAVLSEADSNLMQLRRLSRKTRRWWRWRSMMRLTMGRLPAGMVCTQARERTSHTLNTAWKSTETTMEVSSITANVVTRLSWTCSLPQRFTSSQTGLTLKTLRKNSCPAVTSTWNWPRKRIVCALTSGRLTCILTTRSFMSQKVTRFSLRRCARVLPLGSNSCRPSSSRLGEQATASSSLYGISTRSVTSSPECTARLDSTHSSTRFQKLSVPALLAVTQASKYSRYQICSSQCPGWLSSLLVEKLSDSSQKMSPASLRMAPTLPCFCEYPKFTTVWPSGLWILPLSSRSRPYMLMQGAKESRASSSLRLGQKSPCCTSFLQCLARSVLATRLHSLRSLKLGSSVTSAASRSWGTMLQNRLQSGNLWVRITEEFSPSPMRSQMQLVRSVKATCPEAPPLNSSTSLNSLMSATMQQMCSPQAQGLCSTKNLTKSLRESSRSSRSSNLRMCSIRRGSSSSSTLSTPYSSTSRSLSPFLQTTLRMSQLKSASNQPILILPSILMILLTLLPALVSPLGHYIVEKVETSLSGYSLSLRYQGNETYYGNPKSPIVLAPLFTVRTLTRQDLTFKLTDPSRQRFEIPKSKDFPQDPFQNFTFPINNSDFIFSFSQRPFTFRVILKSSNDTLFDSSQGDLVFSDYYLQISTATNSRYLFGLGQRNAEVRVRPGNYTIMNRDRALALEDQDLGKNTYGYYPLAFHRGRTSNWHITYLRSTSPLAVQVEEAPRDSLRLTYRAIGGVFDFRIFAGNASAQGTVLRLHQMLGASQIPPFWALGMHQSRWGYYNYNDLQQVVNKYRENGLPLDAIWSDIDILKSAISFEADLAKFPRELMANLTKTVKHVSIVEPSVAIGDNFAYNEGKRLGVFIKDANGSDFEGKVWAGPVHYVDFTHQAAPGYWASLLAHFKEQVNFTGVWLDMNELSNFCNGHCNKNYSAPSVFDFKNDLPFSPTGLNTNVEERQLSLNATTALGPYANTQSLQNILQQKYTAQYLDSLGLRPFVLSRATSPGSNRFTAHWTGDNYANYQFLRLTVAGNVISNLWGVQIVGNDICGFSGNTNEQLCSRWFQVGAFSPFMRDHNDLWWKAQEPYALGPTVLATARASLLLRYSILNQLFTQLLLRKGKGTFYRALFLQFGQVQVLDDAVLDTQFLISDLLMVAPVLEQNATSRMVYFPNCSWISFPLGTTRFQPKSSVSLTNRLNETALTFLREGKLIFIQNGKVLNSAELGRAFNISAAISMSGDVAKAAGTIHSLDNPESKAAVQQCLQEDCFLHFAITYDTRSASGQIVVVYSGSQTLQSAVRVERLSMHLPGSEVTIVLDCIVSGNTTIPLADSA